ncbi:MAG: DUF3392 domain-containing protein [Gammaproteobacteria bacterium]|jgi:hypothetical protein|nr:DUF3392 domain-containing protein [Gammaproteobacteria bacterium]MBU1490855.1 DUF3392 domain-containing protein [Gammaproteobacteria bacterium]MBU2067406.1 DUF3392 domain-containing protein [Gammaproteobacteria bacterium]MBU2140716.1 DUF3392 domain-containing protein [Gammaproteobacteria bacterium]MBU2216532.1 DUF3392 domain-containing protein [Gammaproteobacteria bacterium]
MDLLLDLIVTLSRWSRGHLYDISLAIMATLFVLFGPGINASVQRAIGNLNFILRTLIFVAICAVGYGLAMVFITPVLAQGLGHFNNYTLAPVLLLVFFIIGVLADRN